MEYALLIIVSSVVAIALWPVFLLAMDGCLQIYRRLQAPHVVTCPATGEPAALELAAPAPSVFSNSREPRSHVRRCSRWPEHEQCNQACLGQLDSCVDASPREGLEGVGVGIEMGGRPSRSQHGARSAVPNAASPVRRLEPLAGLERWLYRGGRPNRLASLVNRGHAALYALGLWPDYLVKLEVVGRRSGRVITLPLVVAVVAGERYLVSMLGQNVDWVHNVRAAGGKAVLRHGRREEVRLIEVPTELRAPVVKAYVKRAPGARPHVPVHKDAPLSEFEKIASQIPVFRITH